MTDAITSHYSFGGLRQRIENGLAELGTEVTVATLGAVDEFHLGGRPATKHLVDQLCLGPDDHVLDIGSGLGGLARFIASTTTASVTGIDLTEEYVDVAAWLTGLVGLDDLVSFVHGSAQDVPAGSFTAATMLHVGMNIAEKAAVFRHVAEVLGIGGRFVIYDIMATGQDRPDYPCPWAASLATSFLETSDEYVAHLQLAGFTIETVDDRSKAAVIALQQLAADAANGPAPLGLHLVMGPDTSTKVANMAKGVTSGVLAPTEIIATVS